MLRYYITDRRSTRNVLECIVRAAAEGVDFIQLREKDLSARELLALTRSAVAAIAQWPTRILINSRLDIALASPAHGVHLPGSSIPCGEWRRITPAGFLFGVSCHSLEDVRQADGADFVVYGPVFDTPGKPNHLGLDSLRRVAEATTIPVLALGGITAENAESCMQAGAAGIAAIRMFQESCVR